MKRQKIIKKELNVNFGVEKYNKQSEKFIRGVQQLISKI